MSLFSALSVGASGMAAQRARAEVLVENLANAETTRTPGGGPYRRQDVVFESTTVSSPFASVFSSQLQSMNGVEVSGVVTGRSDPERRYLPEGKARDSPVLRRGAQSVLRVFLRTSTSNPLSNCALCDSSALSASLR